MGWGATNDNAIFKNGEKARDIRISAHFFLKILITGDHFPWLRCTTLSIIPGQQLCFNVVFVFLPQATRLQKLFQQTSSSIQRGPMLGTSNILSKCFKLPPRLGNNKFIFFLRRECSIQRENKLRDNRRNDKTRFAQHYRTHDPITIHIDR